MYIWYDLDEHVRKDICMRCLDVVFLTIMIVLCSIMPSGKYRDSYLTCYFILLIVRIGVGIIYWREPRDMIIIESILTAGVALLLTLISIMYCIYGEWINKFEIAVVFLSLIIPALSGLCWLYRIRESIKNAYKNIVDNIRESNDRGYKKYMKDNYGTFDASMPVVESAEMSTTMSNVKIDA